LQKKPANKPAPKANKKRPAPKPAKKALPPPKKRREGFYYYYYYYYFTRNSDSPFACVLFRGSRRGGIRGGAANIEALRVLFMLSIVSISFFLLFLSIKNKTKQTPKDFFL